MASKASRQSLVSSEEAAEVMHGLFDKLVAFAVPSLRRRKTRLDAMLDFVFAHSHTAVLSEASIRSLIFFTEELKLTAMAAAEKAFLEAGAERLLQLATDWEYLPQQESLKNPILRGVW